MSTYTTLIKCTKHIYALVWKIRKQKQQILKIQNLQHIQVNELELFSSSKSWMQMDDTHIYNSCARNFIPLLLGFLFYFCFCFKSLNGEINFCRNLSESCLILYFYYSNLICIYVYRVEDKFEGIQLRNSI